MFRALVIAALLVPLAFVPTAVAHDCPPHVEALDIGTMTGGEQSYYVTTSPAVYEETNRLAGLQTTAGSCSDDNGREFSWAADTKIL